MPFPWTSVQTFAPAIFHVCASANLRRKKISNLPGEKFGSAIAI
jgi:hypothetical protein